MNAFGVPTATTRWCLCHMTKTEIDPSSPVLPIIPTERAVRVPGPRADGSLSSKRRVHFSENVECILIPDRQSIPDDEFTAMFYGKRGIEKMAEQNYMEKKAEHEKAKHERRNLDWRQFTEEDTMFVRIGSSGPLIHPCHVTRTSRHGLNVLKDDPNVLVVPWQYRRKTQHDGTDASKSAWVRVFLMAFANIIRALIITLSTAVNSLAFAFGNLMQVLMAPLIAVYSLTVVSGNLVLEFVGCCYGLAFGILMLVMLGLNHFLDQCY